MVLWEQVKYGWCIIIKDTGKACFGHSQLCLYGFRYIIFGEENLYENQTQYDYWYIKEWINNLWQL